MADINLLGSDNQKTNFTQTSASLAIKILIGLLVLVILYYGFVKIRTSRARNSIVEVQSKTSQLKAEALGDKQRGELITRQGQLQNLEGLIKNHFYWSGLVPELARASLKSSSYTNFKMESSGVMSLDVVVPTYADADKYIQVFDLPQFSRQFSDVKVVSINKIQQGNSVQIELRLELKFNPAFIHKTL
jgi:hypothetical protein